MKLKDLAPVLRSSTGAMQEAVVYDLDNNQDLASGCSVDYAVKHYGDMELDRITAYGHSLVLSVREAAPADDEPEWFGVVRWCDEDIVAALEYKLAPVTEENIRRIHDKLAHHSFTDSMIEQGWDYIHFLIDTELT